MNTFIVIVIVVAIIGIAIYVIRKRFDSEWHGVLADKKIIERQTSRQPGSNTITVQGTIYL